MPTDSGAALAREHRAQAQAEADTAVILVSFILCLANLVLVLSDQAVAQALEVVGQY